jgi:hypothetical protein
MRRLVAAAESEAIGYAGVSEVARATGVSRRAIAEGMKELRQRKTARKGPSVHARIRRKGAGRKRTMDKDPTLLKDLDRMVDPLTRGDPESPLRWTCKSVRRLAEELQQKGHAVSYQTVAELLHLMDYSLQANQSRHADRDEQFEYINRKARRYLKKGEPVISVDTKKKNGRLEGRRLIRSTASSRAEPPHIINPVCRSHGKSSRERPPADPVLVQPNSWSA